MKILLDAASIPFQSFRSAGKEVKALKVNRNLFTPDVIIFPTMIRDKFISLSIVCALSVDRFCIQPEIVNKLVVREWYSMESKRLQSVYTSK